MHDLFYDSVVIVTWIADERHECHGTDSFDFVGHQSDGCPDSDGGERIEQLTNLQISHVMDLQQNDGSFLWYDCFL